MDGVGVLFIHDIDYVPHDLVFDNHLEDEVSITEMAKVGEDI